MLIYSYKLHPSSTFPFSPRTKVTPMTNFAPQTSGDPIKNLIDNIDQLVIDDEAEQELESLDSYLGYVRVMHGEWADGTVFTNEAARIRDLIDRKLLAEYPDEAERASLKASLVAEFPRIYGS